MKTSGKIMSKFMGEEDGKQTCSKRNAPSQGAKPGTDYSILVDKSNVLKSIKCSREKNAEQCEPKEE